jgi:type II secretory pathway component PulF
MLGYSLWRIPEASRDFDEFGVSLPSLTRTVLRVSGTTTENWQTLMPILPLVPLAGFVIAMFIGRCCPVSQKLWVSAATLVLVGCLVCQVVGIELPLMTLRDGLSM